MHWKKLGRVFHVERMEQRPFWMNGFAQAPNAVVLEDVVRVFFCCRSAPDEDMQYVSYCAFVDLARDNLFNVVRVAEKPVLALGGIGTFDEYGTYPVSVLKDGGRLYAAYGGWTRCESVPFNISLGMALSVDGGLTFTKFGNGPVLSHCPDEPFVVTSPKLRKYGDLWVMAYTAGRRWICDADGRPEIIYKLRLATSRDGRNWAKQSVDLVADRLGENEAQACPDIFFKDGIFHLFYCYRHGLDFRANRNRSYRIGYARSTDLKSWERQDSAMNLDVSDSEWDSEMIAYPSVFELDNEVYMFYAGNGNGKTGFGLAKLEGAIT